MFSKQLTKLGKELLLNITKFNSGNDEKVYLMPEYRDYTKCSEECPFFKNREVSNHCQHDCVFVLSTSSIVRNKKKSLSASQIKQLIYYNSVVYENNGLTIELTHADVAKSINCTERTARSNIRELEEAGYIAIKKIGNKYQAFIKDYNKYYKSKGRGYLYLSDKCLYTILNIDNINILRLVILALVKIDDMKISNKKTIAKELSFAALINLLPSNITCPKQIKRIISNTKKIFNIIFKDNSVILSYKNDSVNSNQYSANIKQDNKKALKKLLKRLNINVTDNERADLLQMSIQYNIKIIANVLYSIKSIPAELGSYVRTIIKIRFNNLIRTSLTSF